MQPGPGDTLIKFIIYSRSSKPKETVLMRNINCMCCYCIIWFKMRVSSKRELRIYCALSDFKYLINSLRAKTNDMLLRHCGHVILIDHNMVIFVNKFDILPIFLLLYVIADMRVTRFIVSHLIPAIKRNTPCAAGCCGPKFNVKLRTVVKSFIRNLSTIPTKIEW